MAKLYILDEVLKGTFTEKLKQQEFLNKYVPENRLKRASRYHMESDYRNCINAYCLLRYALFLQYGIKEQLKINYQASGKPYLNDCSVKFNLSHCNIGICCALSEGNIGCDIQSEEIDFEQILEDTMSLEEIKQINISKNKAQMFTRFWTLKESYLKYIGCGLHNHINKIDFSMNMEESFVIGQLHYIVVYREKYYIASCAEEEIKIQWVTYNDMIKGLSSIVCEKSGNE